MLTGEAIVGIATGLDGESMNAKTGAMVQTWFIRPELPPMDAVRQGLDVAICGDCKLRGENGFDRRCYVPPWVGPNNVWKRFAAGGYVDATWREMQALLEGRSVRLAAYGDPASAPFEVVRTLVHAARTWTGYTHCWRTCDQRFKTLLMASVDTAREFHRAGLAGWRTFRIRGLKEPLVAGAEFSCPASEEMGHRTTCEACRLCRGRSSPARSVAILPHGHNGALAAFHKSRRAAEAMA